MAYRVTIQNNTQRLHDYSITPTLASPPSSSEPAPVTPVLYTCKLKPGAKDPHPHPAYDNSLHFCSTVLIDCPRFTVEATTMIITKEGFLPLTHKVLVDMEQVQGEGLQDTKDVTVAVVNHKQAMDGSKLRGSGIQTEFVVTYE